VNSPQQVNQFSDPTGRFTLQSYLGDTGATNQGSRSLGLIDNQAPGGRYGAGISYNPSTGAYWDEASKPNKGIGEWAPYVAAITGLALGGAGLAAAGGAAAGGAGAAGAGAETAGGLGSTFGQGVGSFGGGAGGAGFGFAPAIDFGATTTGLGGSGLLGGAGAGLGGAESLAGLGGGFNFAPGIDFMQGFNGLGGGSLTSGLSDTSLGGQTFGGQIGDVTGGQSFGLSSAGDFGTIPPSTFGGEAIGSLTPFDASSAGIGDIFSKMKLGGKDALSAARSILSSNSNSGSKQMSMSDLAPLLLGLNGDLQSDKSADKMLEWLRGQQAKIDGLYAPGSNEYNSLWQEMSRKDAAAGRNSQVGPRSVDLAARIAQIKADNTTRLTAGTARGMADAFNQQGTARSLPGLSALLGQSGGAGALLGGLGNAGIGALLGRFGGGDSGAGISPPNPFFTDQAGNNSGSIWDTVSGWFS
jgi:hypothetical protein